MNRWAILCRPPDLGCRLGPLASASSTPQGRSTIAHRFNGGCRQRMISASPTGATEDRQRGVSFHRVQSESATGYRPHLRSTRSLIDLSLAARFHGGAERSQKGLAGCWLRRSRERTRGGTCEKTICSSRDSLCGDSRGRLARVASLSAAGPVSGHDPPHARRLAHGSPFSE